MSSESKGKKWINRIKNKFRPSSVSSANDLAPSSQSRSTSYRPGENSGTQQTAPPVVGSTPPEPRLRESVLPTQQTVPQTEAPPVEQRPLARKPVPPTQISPVDNPRPPTPVPPKNQVPKPTEIQALLYDNGYEYRPWERQPTNVNEALCWAASMNKQALIEELLSRGAALVFESGNSWTMEPAIHRAISRRDEALAMKFMDLFPKCINLEDRDKKTPLSVACERGLTALVIELWNRGVDIECRDYLGRTPLHQAARSGRLDTVRCLLERGAEVNAKDHQNRTAEMRAWSGRHDDVAKVLEAANKDLFKFVVSNVESATSRPPPTKEDLPEPILHALPPKEVEEWKPKSWGMAAEPSNGHVQTDPSKKTYAAEGHWDDGFSVVEYKFVKEGEFRDPPPGGDSQSSQGGEPKIDPRAASSDDWAWDAPFHALSYRASSLNGPVTVESQKAAATEGKGPEVTSEGKAIEDDWDDGFPIVGYKVVQSENQAITQIRQGDKPPRAHTTTQDSGIQRAGDDTKLNQSDVDEAGDVLTHPPPTAVTTSTIPAATPIVDDPRQPIKSPDLNSTSLTPPPPPIPSSSVEELLIGLPPPPSTPLPRRQTDRRLRLEELTRQAARQRARDEMKVLRWE